jgi:hypothetical protein
MKTWDQMTALEQAASTYSDMYKDAYGFRPRNNTSDWTLETFQAEFDRMQDIIDADVIEKQAAQERAIQRFETRVQSVIDSGAGDRETALRWIHNAEYTYGDAEFLCFRLGLPYSYFQK